MAGEKIGVVGAGLMGAEIALNFALAGHEVRLNDRSEVQRNFVGVNVLKGRAPASAAWRPPAV